MLISWCTNLLFFLIFFPSQGYYKERVLPQQQPSTYPINTETWRGPLHSWTGSWQYFQGRGYTNVVLTVGWTRKLSADLPLRHYCTKGLREKTWWMNLKADLHSGQFCGRQKSFQPKTVLLKNQSPLKCYRKFISRKMFINSLLGIITL